MSIEKIMYRAHAKATGGRVRSRLLGVLPRRAEVCRRPAEGHPARYDLDRW